MLITNNLSVYKKVYKKFKVSTSLIANDLNVYINAKVIQTIKGGFCFRLFFQASIINLPA